MLLQFSHETQGAFSTSRLITLQSTGDYQLVPIAIVFTQYDWLVRAKRAELRDDYLFMDDDTLDSRSVEEAWKAFGFCLQAIARTMHRLGILMPPYAKVPDIFVPLHYIALTAC